MKKLLLMLFAITTLLSCQTSQEKSVIGRWTNLESNSLGNIDEIEFIDDKNCIIVMSGMMSLGNGQSFCTYKRLNNRLILCDNLQGGIVLDIKSPDTLLGSIGLIELKLIRTKPNRHGE
ncbi:hypothetical protein QWY31_08795 [Cytophagales bacterium LB-30]|uniref:Lipocalin-like domain-containing protein n=1 Tax=Shiella aurantiaca TaxID=3058365 RepID=A0ABT8F550_9BACT|nr:hypothetical protein [Shiella aurantiaca]MDN4165597.1 hypothetical protein [Shiella aurantiaca]